MTDQHEKNADLVEVSIVYPSGHKPAENGFASSTPLRDVKAYALDFFNLKESSDGNNQTVFFLYLRDDKLENLDQPLR